MHLSLNSFLWDFFENWYVVPPGSGWGANSYQELQVQRVKLYIIGGTAYQWYVAGTALLFCRQMASKSGIK
jgi:hypothetical protein